MKILPVGVEFHADGQTEGRQTKRQTEMTKLIDTFNNFCFAKAPNRRTHTSAEE
jgi:hypothetical protein